MNLEEAERYHRQIILPGFGREAQERLRRSSVLIAGAGGLGVPAMQYLAAAGVGRIGIVDGDRVALSNLHRQVIYPTTAIDELKAEVSARKLRELNPEIAINAYPFFLRRDNVLDLLAPFDLVIDGTDTFTSKYLLADACEVCQKTLIQGSVSQYQGQLAVFGTVNGERASYRDLFSGTVSDGEVPSCAEAGVLGVLPGIIGTLQASEAIKLMAGLEGAMLNTLLTFDLLTNKSERFSLPVSRNILSPEKFAETTTQGIGCGLYSDIDPPAFAELLRDPKVRVIDVRDEGEQPPAAGFAHERIPLSDFANLAPHFRDETLVLFCHSGIRSVAAAEQVAAGNRVYNLRGGILKWLRYLDNQSIKP